MRKLIIDTAPKDSLSELEEDTTGFDDVEPRDMLAHLEQNATVTDCIDLDELILQTEEPVPLDGEVTLKTYFKNLERDIKALKEDHDVPTSKKRVQVKILRQLKEHGGFKEEVTTWEGKDPTDRTWTEFKKHFSKADRDRRQRLKFANANKPAGATEYGSANNVNGTDVDVLRRMLNEGMSEIAKAAEDTINLTFEKKMKAGGTDTSSSADTVADLAKKIKALEEENKKLKQRRRSGQRCKHCGGHHHPNFDTNRCWGRQENRHLAPEGWKLAKGE